MFSLSFIEGFNSEAAGGGGGVKNPLACMDSSDELDRIFIQDYKLTLVSSVKILGVHVSSDLKWNVHISYIVAKASKRLYFLRLLKRAGVDQQSMLTVYTTCIRSVLEYGCRVWNVNAPHDQYLSEEVERVQKRALRLICPHFPYSQALEQTQLPTLAQSRSNLCQRLFKNVTQPEHKLHPISPPNAILQIQKTLAYFAAAQAVSRTVLSRGVSPFLILFSLFVF